MQIKAITVNAAGMAAEMGILQGNRSIGVDQARPEDTFGPECRVSISREGKALSSQQQADRTEKNAQSAKAERDQLRRQEEAERAKEIREGYREKLNEVDKTIKDLNASYPVSKKRQPEDDEDPYDAKMMDEAMKNRQDLREAMQSQKDFQTQESQRLAKEAQQMAVQSAKYRQEIDENNQDLLTLLKTMEEAEKTGEEQERGEVKADGNSVSDGASGTQDSAGGTLQASAAQFMTSAVNREWNVEQMLAGFKGDGDWFLDTADSITREMLQKTEGIRTALKDEAVTEEQLAEMMKNLWEGLEDNYENVENYRGWGLHAQRLAREDKIQHIADDPLKGMQETKESLMLSAADAAIGEARQGSLDRTSRELADEVEKLIDERNDVDRSPQDEEKEEEDQLEKAEDEEEQAGMQEKLSQVKEKEMGMSHIS